jgi:hypothetical protein
MAVHPIDVTLPDGRVVTARPLTIRQRIALTAQLAEERASIARRNAEIAGEPNVLASVEKARKEALVASALVLDCYTLAGAMRVVEAASEFPELIGDGLEPKALTELALRLLGFGREDEREAPAGK